MQAKQLTQDLKDCLAAEALLDPSLAHSVFRHRPELWTLAEQFALQFYDRYVQADTVAATFGEFPFSPRLMRYALQDMILSTACYIAYRSTSDAVVTLAHVRQAADRIQMFITRHGVDAIYRIYFVIMGEDFLQPFQHYKDVTEAEVLQGLRHHPIAPERLDHMLMVAMATQMVRLKPRGAERCIQLTKLGATHLRWIREMQAAAGYDTIRTTMSMVYQLDEVHDWEAVCEAVFPEGVAMRGRFVEWAGIDGAKQVLEVSYGSGALTFDRRLQQALDRDGRLVTVDAAGVMPSLANHPLYRQDRMEVRQAPAGRLPFADGVFDACLGSVFLTHTDVRQMIAEMRRTVRVGGVVALVYVLHFDFQLPFLRDWFDPVFRLARIRPRTRNATPRASAAHEVAAWFHEAGLHHVQWKEDTVLWRVDRPEYMIEYLLRGVRWLQRLLMSLPWDDRRSMVLELIDRGRDACRHWGPRDRTLEIPVAMVKGMRVTGM